ncbi:MAG: GAF domain-containing protein [Kofleriaceae bacterium]
MSEQRRTGGDEGSGESGRLLAPPEQELHSVGSETETRERELLQQRAHALEDEVATRRELESALRSALDERMIAETQLAVALASEMAARREAERSREELRDHNRVNETLHRIGVVLNREIELDKLVQGLTDEATALCNAEFGAFFYDAGEHEDSEGYARFTLSGLPREVFASYPMPRPTKVFGPTFYGEPVVRFDDVTKDARYGKNPPYCGMPKGHPKVASYLALSVVSRTGAVLGGLFFGHSKPGVFTSRDEELMRAIAIQAAVAIENSRIYEAERKGRAAAEYAQRRTAKLNAITMSLSRGLTAEQASQTVIHETLQFIGAVAGGVLLLDPSGTKIERFISEGERDAPSDGCTITDLALDDDLPVCEAARTGTVVWVSGHALVQRYPQVAAKPAAVKTLGAIPLVFEGRTLGALGFRFHTDHPLTIDDEQFMLVAARQCAQAIERARLYDAAQVARSAAEAANRAKDEFLAMLGHELRNPLSPIVTALELMRLRGATEGSSEHNVIERQVSHLVRLVDDLLDISRITRGKVTLELRPVVVRKVITKALEIASPLLEQRRHHVTLEWPDGDLCVEGDEVRLSQVFANLLNNAAKYTQQNGEIAIVGRRDGRDLVVIVRDNGIGIAPDLLPHVFDLFVQGYRAPDRGQGGLGIGLALVRSLVALHHGEVTAASNGLGAGSEFVVRLPLLDMTQAVASGPDAPVSAARELPHCTKRRVLIVDDNEDAAMLLAEMLEAVGHEVAVAHDGPRTLDVLRRFHPEVALLDIGLPVMDGYELAAKLQEQLGAEAPRLIAMSGYGQEHDRVRSIESGFEQHFVKPVSLDKLLLAIERPPSA